MKHPKYWKFPSQLDCPAAKCGKTFKTRSKAITHYQDEHARFAIWCEMCKGPFILTNEPKDFCDHYIDEHPKAYLPYQWEKEIVSSSSYNYSYVVNCDD